MSETFGIIVTDKLKLPIYSDHLVICNRHRAVTSVKLKDNFP